MAKKKRGKNSSQSRYKKGLQEKKSLEAFEATLQRLRCATFLKTNTKLMISKEGVCVHKRSLWIDGRYVGQIHRLVVDETMIHEVEIPPGLWGKQMPDSEYEFLYQPRED